MQLAIVADNALTAEGIRRALRHASGVEVVGFATARRDCRLAIATARPDVVLIDDGPGSDATLSRIAEARAAAPDAEIILLTARLDSCWLHEAAAAGATATISRAVQTATLGMLVRELVNGTVYRALTPAPAAATASMGDSLPGLTERELQILRLVAAGGSNARIARTLWVTEQTVKFHLSNVYRKLGVANRTEASHYAHVHGLLDERQPVGPATAHAATTTVAA
jgi:DNA-binding NarL/FixJ family response regulator